MTPRPRRRQFTVDEYYRMAKVGVLNEDDRVELIEGEVIQMPPIGGPHASRVNRLTERPPDLTPSGYRETRVYRRGEPISPLAFPDVAFTIDDLLG